MASIILTTVGSVAGGAFGGSIGSTIGGFAGNILGSIIDESIFGIPTNTTYGPRIESFTIQSAAYGSMIPIVFGKFRISGNIIWCSRLKEARHIETTTIGGKGSRIQNQHISYTYSISLAIAICEGEILNVERIWANNTLINKNAYKIRIYKGTETQLPDVLIESVEGISNTPAYRGIAYVVFEDLLLGEFGNRLPNFMFEVTRDIRSFNVEKIENLIKGIVIIPGSGEFVYDTTIQSKISGSRDEFGRFIQSGKGQTINQHSERQISNSMLSLENLKHSIPNIKWAAPVVGWFVNTLSIKNSKIIPGVEFNNHNETTYPDEWSVAGYTRKNAYQISKTAGKVNWGGTTNDISIVRYIKELKKQGFQIMFLPMLFVDKPGKPWRGYISGAAQDVQNFFRGKEGYNTFILHYAQLVKNYVDAFIIGSELESLTQIQDVNNKFTAVEELILLANEVRKVVGRSVKISYAANWSEYHHSKGGWYHLDNLWASDNIDFIGIDAYFPLTPRDSKIHTYKDIYDGWSKGEGYDFYYDNSNSLKKIPLSSKYAWKNIKWWWENTHQNPDGKKTAWIPKSKKIWFVEYGFPSVECASNEPYKFFDYQAIKPNFPSGSNGNINFEAQRNGIHATIKKWESSDIVENMFLWCWDARPYPFWPNLQSAWSDGPNWSRGHWVQGKIGATNLAEVISNLMIRAGFSENDFDVSEINKEAFNNVEGFALNDISLSIKDAIMILKRAYHIDIFEVDGKICFKSQNTEIKKINFQDCILHKNSPMQVTRNAYSCNKIHISYITRHNYNINNVFLTHDGNAYLNTKDALLTNFIPSKIEKKGQNIQLPIVMSDQHAKNIGQFLLFEEIASKISYSFLLPIYYLFLKPSDIIHISSTKYYDDGNIIHQASNENANITLKIINIDIGNNATLKINAIHVNYLQIAEIENNFSFDIKKPEFHGSIIFEILDIPTLLTESNIDTPRVLVACVSTGEKWPICNIKCFFKEDLSKTLKSEIIEKQSTMGFAIDTLKSANSYTIDRENKIRVSILHGTLHSISEEKMLQGENAAIIGDEILHFSNAKLIENNIYEISNFIRGRQGTESKIANHKHKERFILLNEHLKYIELPKSCIGKEMHWNISCQGLIEKIQKEERFDGINLRPLPPAHIKLYIDDTNHLNIMWRRRSRYASSSFGFSDVENSEKEELYYIEIIKGESKLYSEIVRGTEHIKIPTKTEYQNCTLLISQISHITGHGSVSTVNLLM